MSFFATLSAAQYKSELLMLSASSKRKKFSRTQSAVASTTATGAPSVDSQIAAATKPKRQKYNAKRTQLGDQIFDSAKEARTFVMLTMAAKAHDLSERVVHIERSHRYLLIPAQGGERACHYVADFVVTYADARVQVIDTKSEITRKNALYIVKRKLMLDRHGLAIKEM